MAVLVLGSINMDLVVRAPRLPDAGETISGTSFHTAPGGKGANQAVAAARLGARTAMFGRVGNDELGRQLRQALGLAGIDSGGVLTLGGSTSGIALIIVSDAGDNQIVIVPGANGRVGEPDVERLAARARPGDIVLLQLEIPLATVILAAGRARTAGARVILDPAPAHPDLPDDLVRSLFMITPNQTEASALLGRDVRGVDAGLEAARELHRRGVEVAVVKLGADGACAADDNGAVHVPPFVVEAVDTVGSGDAFNGAVAAALAQARPLDEALRTGAAAGAIAASRSGTQEAFPTRREIDVMLRGTA